MTASFRLFICASVSALGILQASQKQSLNVAEPLQTIAGLPITDSLSSVQAEAAVRAVLPTEQAGTFMLHTVKYQTAKFAVDSQNWYTVSLDSTPAWKTLGDLHAAQRYKDPRMFGVAHLGMVYVYILEGCPSETVLRLVREKEADLRRNREPQEPSSAAALISTNKANLAQWKGFNTNGNLLPALTQREQTLENQTDSSDRTAQLGSLWADIDVETTIGELLAKGSSGKIMLVATSDSSALTPLAGALVRKVFAPLTTLTYGISIESKDKAPFVNLKQIASIAFGGQDLPPLSIPIPLSLMGFAAGKAFDTTLTTSNVVVTATYSNNGSDSQIGTQSYDNEGRYWYDFSLALPFRSYNDLSYDSTANGLTARNIKKNNLYAAFDFGLPRDTKNMKFQLIPVLMYGIPIAGQPLKHHLFAASIGLNYVNFFAGTQLDAKNFYHDFSKPLTGSNVFRAWRTHFVYGINFDVSTIGKALSKSTASASK